MKTIPLITLGCNASLLLLMCVGAAADPVTYTFRGIITEVDPALSGTFDTSQTLSGSFTYESSAVGDLFLSEASGFSNYQNNALVDFTMTIGSYNASPPFAGFLFTGVQVVNNYFGSDKFVLTGGLTGAQFNGLNPFGFLVFDDTSHSEFSDTMLANVGDLTGWTSRPDHSGGWYLAFSNDGGSPRILGQLTSIDLVPVPEPSTLLLFGCGVVLIAIAIRRRYSTKQPRNEHSF